MKALAFLLSLLILLLSGVPCCGSDAQCGDAISGVSRTDADPHNEEPLSKGPCSPFYTCGTCVGFIEAIGLQCPAQVEKVCRIAINTLHGKSVSEIITHRLLRPPIPGFRT